jgi:hypothetical protein
MPLRILKEIPAWNNYAKSLRFDRSSLDKRQEGEIMSRTLGIMLIVVGLIGLAWGGLTYTTREKVVDIGPIHATRDKDHTIPLPPVAGAVALIGGVVLVAAGKK